MTPDLAPNEELPERRQGATAQLEAIEGGFLRTARRFNWVFGILGGIVAIGIAGFVVATVLGSKADGSKTDAKFDAVNLKLGAHDQLLGETIGRSAAVMGEMTSLHDDVRTTNDNLGRVNQNILDHWRGVKPTLTLSPLSTPKK